MIDVDDEFKEVARDQWDRDWVRLIVGDYLAISFTKREKFYMLEKCMGIMK